MTRSDGITVYNSPLCLAPSDWATAPLPLVKACTAPATTYTTAAVDYYGSTTKTLTLLSNTATDSLQVAPVSGDQIQNGTITSADITAGGVTFQNLAPTPARVVSVANPAQSPTVNLTPGQPVGNTWCSAYGEGTSVPSNVLLPFTTESWAWAGTAFTPSTLVTVPETGLYEVKVNGVYAANASGTRSLSLYTDADGPGGLASHLAEKSNVNAASTDKTSVSLSKQVSLAKGQKLSVFAASCTKDNTPVGLDSVDMSMNLVSNTP